MIKFIELRNKKEPMAKHSEYLTYVLEKLEPHGPIKARAMFGGYGIYYGDVMFALIADNELYFRVDQESEKAFIEYSSKRFVYDGMKNKAVSLPYFTLPEEILESYTELPRWIETAYKTALKHKKVKKKK